MRRNYKLFKNYKFGILVSYLFKLHIKKKLKQYNRNKYLFSRVDFKAACILRMCIMFDEVWPETQGNAIHRYEPPTK